MNVTVDSSIIAKVWHLLVHPLPPVQRRPASEIMVRVAREGWARRLDVENILGALGVYAEGDELLVPLSNALQRP